VLHGSDASVVLSEEVDRLDDSAADAVFDVQARRRHRRVDGP